MTDPFPFAESIRRILRPSERGVVGIVDELLVLARDQELQLEWRAGQCQVRPVGVEPEVVVEFAMPRSAFRTVLARLAALCNERVLGSVSPYGGEGELATDSAPATVVRVSFVNTPDEQRLRLTPGPKGEKPRIPVPKSAPAENRIESRTPSSGS